MLEKIRSHRHDVETSPRHASHLFSPLCWTKNALSGQMRWAMPLSIGSTTSLYPFFPFFCSYLQWVKDSVFSVSTHFSMGYPNYPLFGTPPTKGMNLHDQISRLPSPDKHRLRRFSPDWNGIRSLGSALAGRERLLPPVLLATSSPLLGRVYLRRSLDSAGIS